MKTAAQYITTVYGQRTFARALELNDAESIMDLMNDFVSNYVNQMKIYRLCSSCNTEFELETGRTNSEIVSTFQKCPHCNKRNDIWISIRK